MFDPDLSVHYIDFTVVQNIAQSPRGGFARNRGVVPLGIALAPGWKQRGDHNQLPILATPRERAHTVRM